MKLDFGALYSLELPLEENLLIENQKLLPASLGGAAESRKREFIGGRICALKCAADLGVKLSELPIGEKREPLWPAELVGSITHTKKMAMALVDLKTSSRAIGLDAQEIIDEQKIETIEKMVATKKDMAFLKLFAQKRLAYTVLFSAKESLYKLIYPLAQEFFGFQEAQLKALDLESGEFILKLESENPALASFLGIYRGQFFNEKGHIISVLRLGEKATTRKWPPRLTHDNDAFGRGEVFLGTGSVDINLGINAGRWGVGLIWEHSEADGHGINFGIRYKF